MKKKILIAITITLVIMVIIISVLLTTLEQTINKNELNQGDIGKEINFDESKIEMVSDNIDFFTIRNCIQNYMDKINMKSSTYYDGVEMIMGKEEIIQGIYDLLSEDYIIKNSITTENLLNKIDKIEEKVIFVPLKMNYLELETTTKYAVYGFCQTLNNQYVKDLYFVVNVDEINNVFSITPLEEELFKSVDEINLNREKVEIENNANNTIQKQKITDQYLCEQYFLLQKRIMLARTEKSYDYLDKEYKNKRFKTLENYINYVSENKNHLIKMVLKEYEVNRNGDITEYICKDQFGNYYIFNAEQVMNYKVQLDAYTIASEKIVKQYNKYTEEKKVSYNVTKFIQMLNNKDYENAYNLLNETFRKNNWESVEEFKKYIQQRYPVMYEIEYGQYKKYGGNHTQTIILKDVGGNIDNQRSMTIIMKLKDNMEFEMSFNIE